MNFSEALVDKLSRAIHMGQHGNMYIAVITVMDLEILEMKMGVHESDSISAGNSHPLVVDDDDAEVANFNCLVSVNTRIPAGYRRDSSQCWNNSRQVDVHVSHATDTTALTLECHYEGQVTSSNIPWLLAPRNNDNSADFN